MDRPYIICCILSALDGKPPVHLREQTLMPEELSVILKENFGIELTTEQIRYFAG